jgi:hypothetical protein
MRGYVDAGDAEFAVREFYQEGDLTKITAAQVVDWMWWIEDNDATKRGTDPATLPPAPAVQDDGAEEELFGGYVGGGRGGRGDEG